MLIWGFNYVAIKLALREVDPLAFLTLRNGIALFVLLSVFLVVERRWTVRRADLVRLLLIGVVGVTVNQIAFNVGMKYTSAANASILITTSPIFGLFFGMFLEKERVSSRRWLGVAAALVGVGLIIAGGQQGLHFGLDNVVGDLLVLAGSASWALYSVLGRPILKFYSPLQLTMYGLLIGVPFMLPVTTGAVLAQPWSALSGLGWAMILYAGILISFTSVLWYRSIGKVGASRALIFMYLVPLFAVVSAVLVLQESLSALQLAGAVVALLGVSIARQG
jgi:drug/metabolite transporter (DMT)-like permease